MKTGTLFCIQSTIYHIRVLNTNTNFSLIQKSATQFFQSNLALKWNHDIRP